MTGDINRRRFVDVAVDLSRVIAVSAAGDRSCMLLVSEDRGEVIIPISEPAANSLLAAFLTAEHLESAKPA